MTIYVYSSDNGQKVAEYSGADNATCEALALADFDTNDYSFSYTDHYPAAFTPEEIESTARRDALAASQPPVADPALEAFKLLFG